MGGGWGGGQRHTREDQDRIVFGMIQGDRVVAGVRRRRLNSARLCTACVAGEMSISRNEETALGREGPGVEAACDKCSPVCCLFSIMVTAHKFTSGSWKRA